MKRRVVVTGLGAVTPIGNTVEEFWNGIREGKVGIGPITKFDVSDYKVQIAAEVKGFVAKERMDFKAAKRMELFSQYAVAAAKEAFEDAGLDMSKEDAYRTGVIVGSGIGSLQAVETNYTKIVEKGPSRVNPLMVSFDDFQYGGRECIDSAWAKRKMHKCRDSLRFRDTLYRRCVPRDSVWGRGCDGCGRYRE